MAENEYPVDDDGYEWTEWEGRDYWRAAGSEDEWNLWGGEETNEIPDASPDKFATDSNYENEPFYDEEEDEDYEFSDSNGFGYRRVASIVVVISLLAVGSWAFFIEDSAMNSAQKTDPDSPLTDDWMVYSVASDSDLPICDSSTNGRLYYVESDANFQVCRNLQWVEIALNSTIPNSSYNPQPVLTTSSSMNNSRACDISEISIFSGDDNGEGNGTASNGFLESDEIDLTTTICKNAAPSPTMIYTRGIDITWREIINDKLIYMSLNYNSTFQIHSVNLSTGQRTESGNYSHDSGMNMGATVISSNSRVYFLVSNETYGVELWSTDGSPNGTGIVKDIIPGADGSHPTKLHVYGNELFFKIETGISTGYGGDSSNIDPMSWTSVWKTDGTEAGTIEVLPEAGIGFFSNDSYLFLENETILSGVGIQLSKFNLNLPISATNPSRSGNLILGESLQEMDCFSGSCQSTPHPANLHQVGQTGNFYVNIYGWKYYDSNLGQTSLLNVNLNSQEIDDAIRGGFYLSDYLLHVQRTADEWGVQSGVLISHNRVTGVEETLLEVRNLATEDYSFFESLHVSDNRLYFIAQAQARYGLYVTDGTVNGTELVSGLDSTTSSIFPKFLLMVNDYIYLHDNYDSYGSILRIDLQTGNRYQIADNIEISNYEIFNTDGEYYFRPYYNIKAGQASDIYYWDLLGGEKVTIDYQTN